MSFSASWIFRLGLTFLGEVDVGEQGEVGMMLGLGLGPKESVELVAIIAVKITFFIFRKFSFARS